MIFLLMHQSILPADAIGNDIIETQALLAGHRHECYVFGSNRCEGVPAGSIVDETGAARLLQDPGVVAIYHHSIYWRSGEALLKAAKARIIFKYHNVTPANFFAMTGDVWRRCAAGREQTYRFAANFGNAFWFSASRFNLAELGLEKVVRHAIVPPFVSNLRPPVSPAEGALRSLLDDPSFKLLAVSRFVPNKGHLFLIDVLTAYRELFGGGVKIFLVGGMDEACRGYFNYVMAAAEGANLGDSFVHLGNLSGEGLLAYYLGSDAYICVSEHEGFCVPVIEAAANCLPVIARAKAALPETLGPDQALFGEDPEEYAVEIHRLRTDVEYRQMRIAQGLGNYRGRFTPEVQRKVFLDTLSYALGFQA